MENCGEVVRRESCSHHSPLDSSLLNIKMNTNTGSDVTYGRAGHAAKAADEKVQEKSAAVSKEANKAVMHDSNAPTGDRISSAAKAAKEAVSEEFHGAKYDHEKKRALH